MQFCLCLIGAYYFGAYLFYVSYCLRHIFINAIKVSSGVHYSERGNIEGVFVCHSDAFLIFCAYVDPVCNFVSAKASWRELTLARVSLFLCIFLSAKKCCLRKVWRAYNMLIRYALCLLRRTVFDACINLCAIFLPAKKCCLRQFGAFLYGAYICLHIFPFVCRYLRHIFNNLINVSTL